MIAKNVYVLGNAVMLGVCAVLLSGVLAANAAGGIGGGHPGSAGDVNRTIEIAAGDTYFDQAAIRIRDGETIRFVIRNTGELVHDFTIGPPEAQAAHRQAMANMGGDMEMDHQAGHHGNHHGMTEPSRHGHAGMHHHGGNAVIIAPGETAEIIWRFEKTTDLEFACNVPGHYEAGMVGDFEFGD